MTKEEYKKGLRLIEERQAEERDNFKKKYAMANAEVNENLIKVDYMEYTDVWVE